MEEDAPAHLARLEAALAATQMGIRALVLTHVRPKLAASAIVDLLETTGSDRAPEPPSDALVEGVALARARMLPTPAQWRQLGLFDPAP